MRFRLGLITGFAGGYYLGTKAGRERHEQINKVLRRAQRSDAFEAAADTTRNAVTDKVDAVRDKASELVDSRLGNGQTGGASLS